jgi:hypothetical protein
MREGSRSQIFQSYRRGHRCRASYGGVMESTETCQQGERVEGRSQVTWKDMIAS